MTINDNIYECSPSDHTTKWKGLIEGKTNKMLLFVSNNFNVLIVSLQHLHNKLLHFPFLGKLFVLSLI